MPWLPSRSAADMPTRLPPTMRTGTSTSDIAARFYVPAGPLSTGRALFQLIPHDVDVREEGRRRRLRIAIGHETVRHLPVGRLFRRASGFLGGPDGLDELAVEVRVHLHVRHRHRPVEMPRDHGVDVRH